MEYPSKFRTYLLVGALGVALISPAPSADETVLPATRCRPDLKGALNAVLTDVSAADAVMLDIEGNLLPDVVAESLRAFSLRHASHVRSESVPKLLAGVEKGMTLDQRFELASVVMDRLGDRIRRIDRTRLTGMTTAQRASLTDKWNSLSPAELSELHVRVLETIETPSSRFLAGIKRATGLRGTARHMVRGRDLVDFTWPYVPLRRYRDPATAFGKAYETRVLQARKDLALVREAGTDVEVAMHGSPPGSITAGMHLEEILKSDIYHRNLRASLHQVTHQLLDGNALSQALRDLPGSKLDLVADDLFLRMGKSLSGERGSEQKRTFRNAWIKASADPEGTWSAIRQSLEIPPKSWSEKIKEPRGMRGDWVIQGGSPTWRKDKAYDFWLMRDEDVPLSEVELQTLLRDAPDIIVTHFLNGRAAELSIHQLKRLLELPLVKAHPELFAPARARLSDLQQLVPLYSRWRAETKLYLSRARAAQDHPANWSWNPTEAELAERNHLRQLKEDSERGLRKLHEELVRLHEGLSPFPGEGDLRFYIRSE